MDSINSTNPNRLDLLFNQDTGEATSLPPAKTGITDASAIQAAFSQFQTYRLNQGMPVSSPPENTVVPQSFDITSLILNAWRAISESLQGASGTPDEQPIPVGFETGPHWVQGWGYQMLANNTYYADDATAQRLADALGAKVVSGNPFGQAQAPDAATLQFPGGQTINAGVLANLLNRGYPPDYVQSQLQQALTDNGVTGASVDMSKLYPAT